MAMSISKSFTADGAGGAIGIRTGDSFSYSLTGTFVANIYLERSYRLNGWKILNTFTAPASGTVVVDPSSSGDLAQFRFRCDGFVSGTAVTSITKLTRIIQKYITPDNFIPLQIDDDGVPTLVRLSQKYLIAAGGKVGATSGFSINPATDKAILASCPASKTGSTLVVPLPNLKPGATIQGYYLNGNLVSAGGTITVDAALRSLTPAIAGATDAAVSGGGITQVSKTAGYVLLPADGISGIGQLVADGVTYYLLVTVTTGSACTVEIDNITLVVDEA